MCCAYKYYGYNFDGRPEMECPTCGNMCYFVEEDKEQQYYAQDACDYNGDDWICPTCGGSPCIGAC